MQQKQLTPFQLLARQLEVMCIKEKQVTEGMRSLATHVDELFGDIDSFKHLLETVELPNQKLQSKSSSDEPVVFQAANSVIIHENAVFPARTSTPLNEGDIFAENLESVSGPDLASIQPLLPEVLSEIELEELKVTEPLPRAEEPLHVHPFLRDAEKPHDSSFEFDMGIKWLSRIGIVALLIGIAMALCYTFPSFSNPMKIMTGFIVAGLLYGTGQFLFKQAAVLGRILQGGGLSVGYISLFAVFFIPQVQLIDSPGVGLFALFGYVAGTLYLAHRLNSQTVGTLSMLFGYYTSLFAESAPIALISSSFLSLATVGLTKLHPEWRTISKANLLGALFIYLIWNGRSSLANHLDGQIYLVFTFMLFHIVSLLRAHTGDLLLNQINTFGFYTLYAWSQPAIGSIGVLELFIAATQVGSLLLLPTHKPESPTAYLRQGLLMTGLLFLGIGTVRYFDGKMVPTVLAGEALSIAFLSKRSEFKKTVVTFAYLLLGIASIMLTATWTQLSDVALLASAAWIAATGMILEYGPFRQHEKVGRVSLVALSQLLILTAVLKVVTPEWRTFSLALTGFIHLAAGFSLPRKFYRIMGLCWIFLVGGPCLLLDLASLSMGYKILLFILLGIGLLAGSLGYSILAKRLLPQKTELDTVASDPQVELYPEESAHEAL